MIRLMLVDDHPAMRTGLLAVLDAEPGLVPVGAAEHSEEALALYQRAKPDVVLLDVHLPGESSLVLCRRLKSRPPAPRVLFYSAHADASVGVSVVLAGGDGLLSKGAPARELFDAIRTVHRGGTMLPAADPAAVQRVRDAVPEEDRPLMAMLLDGATPADAGRVMGLDPEAMTRRVDRLLSRLERGVVPV
ncbi:MAG TPA: response regulator transcription factor [Solirubrobacteraceae bacterium]|nr:response regulator transcription factor [Solirubrobacteraceae bacterium]HSD82023.1 response regulator transcription factor [Solirubrobacteraceae bacterium]